MTPAEAKAFCLALKPEDITKTLIDTKFSSTFDKATGKVKPPIYRFDTEFTLNAGEFKGKDGAPVNKTTVKTNIGQFIVNQCLYGRCPRIQKVVGYTAEPFSKKVIWANEAKMAGASIERKIEPEDWAIYFNCIQWLGFTMNTNVSASFTPNTCRVLPEVKKARDKMYKENQEAIEKGDMVTAVKIEKSLTKLAEEKLKNDVGMTIYDSGCKPTFGNNYKNCFVTRGPIWNPAKEKFYVMHNGFNDGLRKEDIAAMGTSVITGSYTKCCLTSVAGYITKKLFTVYQGVALDKPGSDCHTKGYRTVTITKDNAVKLKNRFIIEGSKLVELTAEVMPKYIGRTVKMRSPLYCTGEKICSKCMGTAFYTQGITNVGLTASSIGSNLLNRFMKAFHDPTSKLVKIDTAKIEV